MADSRKYIKPPYYVLCDDKVLTGPWYKIKEAQVSAWDLSHYRKNIIIVGKIVDAEEI